MEYPVINFFEWNKEQCNRFYGKKNWIDNDWRICCKKKSFAFHCAQNIFPRSSTFNAKENSFLSFHSFFHIFFSFCSNFRWNYAAKKFHQIVIIILSNEAEIDEVLITFSMHNCLLNGAWFSVPRTFAPFAAAKKRAIFCVYVIASTDLICHAVVRASPPEKKGRPPS